jgi:hypothetical protein
MVFERKWYALVIPGIVYMASIGAYATAIMLSPGLYSIVVGIGGVNIYNTETEGHGTINAAKLAPIILTTLALSLAQNILITSSHP